MLLAADRRCSHEAPRPPDPVRDLRAPIAAGLAVLLAIFAVGGVLGGAGASGRGRDRARA